MANRTQISNKWKVLTLVTFFLAVVACSLTLTMALSLSHSRSNGYTNATIKDFSPATSILDMRRKLFNLGAYLVKQEERIEKLTGKFTDEIDSLKEVIAGHEDIYGDLDELATGDTNLFAESHETCGGVLVGQSGSITFTSDALKNTRHPTTCTWTIRANNRRTIKIAMQPSKFPQGSKKLEAYVVELLWEHDKNNDTIISHQGLKTKITKLQSGVYTLTGPVVFVVYPLANHRDHLNYNIELRLKYEGFDRLIEKTTLFAHENLEGDSGTYTDDQVDFKSQSEMKRHSYASTPTYSTVYTSLVISNFSTKVHLEADLEKRGERCGHKDTFFLVITDILSDATITNCCETNCTGKNSLLNYDNPFIIITRRRFSEYLEFKLKWEADIVYPSSSSSNQECGEIIGGFSGTLHYKQDMDYTPGERCIWVISPQPRTRTIIRISMSSFGLDSSYDHFYMMELVNVDGTPLVNGPRITNLRSGYVSYASSREVYVVFISNSLAVGQGFSLNWQSTGNYVKSSTDVTTRFNILKSKQGDLIPSSEMPTLYNQLYKVFLLTPSLPNGLTYEMELSISQTSNPSKTLGCLGNDTSVYTAVNGVFTKSNFSSEKCSLESSDSSKMTIENNGLGVIVMKEPSNDSLAVRNYLWRDLDDIDLTETNFINDNKCGGVVNKNKGILKYKFEEYIDKSERCIWLLQTPNHTKIKLRLLYYGFNQNTDEIVVSRIDLKSGTLLNNTSVINRQRREEIFGESVLVLIFQANLNLNDNQRRGFALMFSGDGERNGDLEYSYHMKLLGEPIDTFQYPSAEWVDGHPKTKNIFIVAYNLNEVDARTMQTKLNWNLGPAKMHNNTNWCKHNAATVYTFGENNQWLESANFPDDNMTESCTNGSLPPNNTTITLPDSTFLMVYIPSAIKRDEERMDMTPLLGFNYETVAGCGGVINADAGVISYKENGRYFNDEECIWLIYAPKASKIGLQLQRGWFDWGYDKITVLKINLVNGSPEHQAVITHNTNTIVEGPMIIVIFNSNGGGRGNGFRLNFSTEVETTEPSPASFNLVHRSQPRLHERFVLNTKSNEIMVLAYSPELIPQSNRGIPQVTLQTFRPEVDENCVSDKVTIYEVSYGMRGVASYTAVNVLENDSLSKLSNEIRNGTCSPLENSNFNTCQGGINDCVDTPKNNVVRTGDYGFVIVSVGANSTGNVHNRGLVINVDVPE